MDFLDTTIAPDQIDWKEQYDLLAQEYNEAIEAWGNRHARERATQTHWHAVEALNPVNGMWFRLNWPETTDYAEAREIADSYTGQARVVTWTVSTPQVVPGAVPEAQ